MTSRVSDLSLSQNSIQHLQAGLAGIAELQNQASTGKKLTKPSDSPIDIGQSLQLRCLAARAPTSSRTTSATPKAGSVPPTPRSGRSSRSSSRSTRWCCRPSTAPATRSRATRIANQIEQIRQSLLGLANTQYGNRPLFGGTASGAVAYDASGAYVGTSAAVERTIAPGVQVQVNVNGDTVFGTPGNDLFTTLDQIADAVHGNQSLVALSAQLKAQTQTVQTAQANVGATYARVDATKTQNTTNASTMNQNLSRMSRTPTWRRCS